MRMLTIQPTIIWLVALIVFLVLEIISMGLTTIWFAGGSLIAAILAVLGAPFWLQIVVFFVVSCLLLAFTRPIAVKYFNKDRVRTNVESLVGREAIVVSEINNLQGVGRVTVGGQEWSARTTVNDRRMAVGTVGIVRAIDGVKLIIEERKEEN
jgi:membrane protein implicated in regulation of membrane protease activity